MNTPTFLATYAPQYVRTIVTDRTGPIETRARRFADNIGVDPWDVCIDTLADFTTHSEQPPVSRFRLGSPCRFVRSVDVVVHVVLPEMVVERFPFHAAYLRSTSPRWGRTWRKWA
jgi:hypothetical protein